MGAVDRLVAFLAASEAASKTVAMADSEFECPICRHEVRTGSRHFPFCSERCKLMDLGLWMTGSYRISRRLDPLDVDSFDPEGEGLNDLRGPEDLVDGAPQS